jgi:hypothetical protein
MSEPFASVSLLRQAAKVYDAPGSPLPRAARASWSKRFTGGASWMRLAMAQIRGESPPERHLAAEAIGVTKYGFSTLAALPALYAAHATGSWPLVLAAIASFYAMEAQYVFAFPLAIDGAPHPLRNARAMTVRAGGTLAMMTTILPIASFMLLGGWFGQGFIRSWCMGCLAVVLLYETHRCEGSERNMSPSSETFASWEKS